MVNAFCYNFTVLSSYKYLLCNSLTASQFEHQQHLAIYSTCTSVVVIKKNEAPSVAGSNGQFLF